jgi:predicted kinase
VRRCAGSILMTMKSHRPPLLILLNGFAGCGKTTLASRYRDDHPLTLALEVDQIITMLGQWSTHWDEAAACKLALSEQMVETHLGRGYDVILPFLLTKVAQAEAYEQIATRTGARYIEVYLAVERAEAIRRLLVRGSWGEAGSPPFTEKDHPEIEDLYDRMVAATAARKNFYTIHPVWGDIDTAYQALLAIVAGKTAVAGQ